MINTIMKDTLKLIFEKWVILIKVLFPYMVILMVTDAFMQESTARVILGKTQEGDIYTVAVGVIMSALMSLLIAVKTHRILLLPSFEISALEFLQFGYKEVRFLWISVILSVMTFVIPVMLYFIFKLLGIIPMMGVLVGIIVSSFIVARLSMVLPSCAIGQHMSFKDSWHLTQKYKWLSYFIIILYPILISVVLSLVYGFVINFLAALLSLDLSVMMVVLNVCITVLIISAISSMYRYISCNCDEFKYEVVCVDDDKIKE